MKRRPLGRTGLHVSAIGFGTWGLGGTSKGSVSYGPTDDAESVRALRLAVERGVTFFDTSDFYGFGHSEAILGQAIESVRPEVTIATKGGLISASEQDFSEQHLESALEGSLARLKTDHVDVYLLHSPPLDQLSPDSPPLALLQRWVSAGKTRSWGISVRSPDEGLVAVRELNAPVIQVNFNLTDQRALDNGLFALCRERGCGVIVRTPLCFGFLTGQYAPGARFHELDHRSRWEAAQVRRWQEARDAFNALIEAEAPGSPAQVALRYCLSFDAVSTVIPGMLTTAQVEENVLAGDLDPLPGQSLARARDIYRQHEFFIRSTTSGQRA